MDKTPVNLLMSYERAPDKTHAVTLFVVGLPSIEAAELLRTWASDAIPKQLKKIGTPVGFTST